MACHAAPDPLRHMSGLSWVSDEDAPRWSFGTFPPVMTGTWWPASLLEQSSGPREELWQIVIHILNMYCRYRTLTWLWQEHTNTDCFTMQKQCPDLHFQSQSSASWAGIERQRRDFWQNRHYCCSDAEDAGTGLHKAQYPLQTASQGTTHTNKQHFVT